MIPGNAGDRGRIGDFGTLKISGRRLDNHGGRLDE
jgi:hypothetical protein